MELEKSCSWQRSRKLREEKKTGRRPRIPVGRREMRVIGGPITRILWPGITPPTHSTLHAPHHPPPLFYFSLCSVNLCNVLPRAVVHSKALDRTFDSVLCVVCSVVYRGCPGYEMAGMG